MSRKKNEEVEIKNAEVMPKSKRLPKDHKDYWKQRIFRKKYTNKKTGRIEEVGAYSVTLTHQKHREYFNLNESNKTKAAGRAKEIYQFLKANNWDATLEKYKPKAEEEAELITIGDLIRVANQKAEVRPLTFRQYKGALRRVAGAMKGIKSNGKGKFRPDIEAGGEWQAKVDKVKLEWMTTERVQAWRKKQLEGMNPVERKRKEVSLNSTLNQARSIWKHSGLPSPFEGLKWKQTTRKFQPSVEAPHLLYWADKELEKQELEQYKALALCLFLGLRRREADCLTWAQIDFEAAKLKIETTDYFKPKSEHSEREIPIQKSLLDKMRKWQESPTPIIKRGVELADNTFVLKGRIAKPNSPHTYYRAENTWSDLTAWLKTKGMDSSKPIHALRKLSGSLMYSANDIYAAQRFLGHSDIRTTIDSYVHEGEKTFDLQAEKPEEKAE